MKTIRIIVMGYFCEEGVKENGHNYNTFKIQQKGLKNLKQ